MSVSREEFIAKLNEGKVLLYRCRRCSNLQLATIVFCRRCNSDALDVVEEKGEGRVVTFTILYVPPEGYEGYAPYGWAVVRLDSGVNISGFIDVKSAKDLPLDSRVRIVGYDGRGIVLKAEDGSSK
ncbi:MAG: OB-fold domain-containing protein [Candidatus Nitrosocaldus sp.]|nr:OB-fold domain-containing protein [Candidatus Nitrosocaldus sp.]MCS7140857.1 OB-fold domain-containing protein [Candidatus Nitrosocaldus sp.]MDW7999785.1 OB-fold domain-containing protein [Candidatus Nitrosocaldus sp.]MDW8274854.1 OB-fold domain-containing protein [Candidatus Nitrosocaldus sp.]